jgi:hypothetical protein
VPSVPVCNEMTHDGTRVLLGEYFNNFKLTTQVEDQDSDPNAMSKRTTLQNY